MSIIKTLSQSSQHHPSENNRILLIFKLKAHASYVDHETLAPLSIFVAVAINTNLVTIGPCNLNCNHDSPSKCGSFNRIILA